MATKIILLSIYLFQVAISQRWPLSGSCYPCTCTISQEGYGRVKYVNCSSLSLDRIPNNLPLDLHSLDLSNNNILPQYLNQVCTFKSLQYVFLSHNTLSFIPTNTFQRCHDLVHLNLTGNMLTRLERTTFKGMSNLQAIYGLQVDDIDDSAFKDLTKLKIVEMTYNGVAIPGNIFHGLLIQELKLTVNILQTLPLDLFNFGAKSLNDLTIIGPKITFVSENSFRGLSVLRKIYLDLKDLVGLPGKIFHNGQTGSISSKPRNLQEIWIKNIHSIPTEIFKDLENLNKLVLHGISDIPSSDIFKYLLNLEYLDIMETNINQIPENWFGKLYSLKTLKLRNVGIRTMEAGDLAGLIHLKELDLSFNSLRQVEPKSLEPLVKSIENIDLRGNILKSIDSNLFQNMYNLVALDISDNKLETVDQDAFVDLRQLIVLDMRDNKLSGLPVGVFKNLKNLQFLKLAMNTFTKFPKATDKTGYLLNLDFSNNRITRLPSKFHENFPYLEYLNLYNNPIFCDCESLKTILIQTNLEIIGTCVVPGRFAWKNIADIQIEECVEQTSHIWPSVTYDSSSSLVSRQTPQLSENTLYVDVTYRTTPAYITSYSNYILTTDDQIVNLNSTSEVSSDYKSTFLQPTPPLLMESLTNSLPELYDYNLSKWLTSTQIITSSDIKTTSYIPPIFKEASNAETITDSLVFRVSIGVLAGGLFICGFAALVLWRKRIKQRKRYEVTATNVVV